MKIDKNRFKASGGQLITQSLFIEYQYNPDMAIYTVEEHDKEYKGVTYPSLKRLYLEAEDVHEYDFAKANLYSWEHWLRLLENKWCRKFIDNWREELEVKIASGGVQSILDLAEGGNFQAAKYVADRQWNKKRGRPSKDEIAKNQKVDERINKEFEDDIDRVSSVVSINDKR